MEEQYITCIATPHDQSRDLGRLHVFPWSPHWNWRMLRHIYVADRLALNNRNANKTKEIGVRMCGGRRTPVVNIIFSA